MRIRYRGQRPLDSSTVSTQAGLNDELILQHLTIPFPFADDRAQFLLAHGWIVNAQSLKEVRLLLGAAECQGFAHRKTIPYLLLAIVPCCQAFMSGDWYPEAGGVCWSREL